MSIDPDHIEATCPLCRSAHFHVLFHLGHADGEHRHAYRCKSCSFVFMYPRLTYEFLDKYYNEAKVYAFGSSFAQDYGAVIADKVSLIGRFLQSTKNAPTSGLAVDYGAGVGTTVKAIENLGFDGVGIEISAKSRETANTLFGVDMRGGTLEQFDNNEISFLTMFDVMEHILEPREFVADLYTKIAAHGLVMIGVPNFDSLDRMVAGVNSQAMTFPEHVNHFTKKSLASMMEGAGFEVRYIGSPPPYGVGISFGLRRTITRLFGRNDTTQLLHRLLGIVKRYVVYPVPNFFVEHTGLLGQSLFIVAQKPLA